MLREVQQLPGVHGAAIWLHSPQRLRALHLAAGARASGLILAKAAASILQRHAIAFDMDMIRIAFRDATRRRDAPLAEEAASATHASVRFLLLHDLTITRAGSRVTCTVAVQRGAHFFEGMAIELDTEAGRVRAAARATLAAAERAEHNLALGLEGTALLDLFGRRYVAASVEAAVERRFATLAGLVPIDPARSPEEAGCLAALRAVDRWIAG